MNTRCVLAVMAILSLFGFATPAFSDIEDYEFQLVQNDAKKGEAAIAVRLMNTRTGRAVPDAVISAKRIDMAPEGMPTMTAELQPLPSTEPGIYQFKTNLAMEGRWQLSLAAKVQGEPGTLQSRLTLKVTD